MHGSVDQGKKYVAYNTHLNLCLLGFLTMLMIAVSCFVEHEIAMGMAFLLVCLLAVFIALLSPIYYIFTKREVTIVFLFGIREKIRWSEIRDISEYGSWLSNGGGLPRYLLSYPRHKKVFYVTGEIAKTRKTKRLIQTFYHKEIL